MCDASSLDCSPIDAQLVYRSISDREREGEAEERAQEIILCEIKNKPNANENDDAVRGVRQDGTASMQ